jgi:hypothetical protein
MEALNCIAVVPQELFLEIMSFLPLIQAKRNERVCWNWCQALNTDDSVTLWKDYCLRYGKLVQFEDTIARFCHWKSMCQVLFKHFKDVWSSFSLDQSCSSAMPLDLSNVSLQRNLHSLLESVLDVSSVHEPGISDVDNVLPASYSERVNHYPRVRRVVKFWSSVGSETADTNERIEFGLTGNSLTSSGTDSYFNSYNGPSLFVYLIEELAIKVHSDWRLKNAFSPKSVTLTIGSTGDNRTFFSEEYEVEDQGNFQMFKLSHPIIIVKNRMNNTLYDESRDTPITEPPNKKRRLNPDATNDNASSNNIYMRLELNGKQRISPLTGMYHTSIECIDLYGTTFEV